jgi:hypothetical protein
MSWNYRVCKKTHEWSIGKGKRKLDGTTVIYALHEVYYNAAGEIVATTEKPMEVLTDTSPGNCEDEIECLDALAQTLTWMGLALQKDVIDLDTIVYADWDEPDPDEEDDDE